MPVFVGLYSSLVLVPFTFLVFSVARRRAGRRSFIIRTLRKLAIRLTFRFCWLLPRVFCAFRRRRAEERRRRGAFKVVPRRGRQRWRVAQARLASERAAGWLPVACVLA